MKKVNLSLAAYPGSLVDFIPSLVAKNKTDPLFGELSLEEIQLVPQVLTPFEEGSLAFLKHSFPDSSFRFHANVYLKGMPRVVYDLSNWKTYWKHFERLAYLSKELSCKGYSAHSGLRSVSDIETSIEGIKALTDLFECPVAIEGQYPTKEGSPYVLSTWQEYADLLTRKVPFVIDLSHLNILKHQSAVLDLGLVKELISSEYCLEVHVSENDGRGDQHQRCKNPNWWFSCMDYIHEEAIVFYEGNLMREISR